MRKLVSVAIRFLRSIVEPGVIAVLCVGIAYIFYRWVPYNMDEFTVLRPSIPWKIFNWKWVLFQSWPYTGALDAYLYILLQMLWRNPMSVRFFDLAFLAIQAFLIGKLFRMRPLTVFILLCSFFAYFIEHLIDTGPILFATTSIYLLVLIFRQWGSKHFFLFPILTGLILALGIYEKLTYLWVLPGIGILWIATQWESGGFSSWTSFARLCLQVLLVVAVIAALSTIIFFSTGGQVFLDSLSTGKVEASLNVAALGALLNPLRAVERVYVWAQVPPSIINWIYDGFLYLSAPVGMLFVAAQRLKRNALATPIAAYFAFILTELIIITTKQSWAMHHVVLAFPFLIISLFSTGSLIIDPLRTVGQRIILTFLLIIFLALNAHYFLLIPTLSPYPYTISPSPTLDHLLYEVDIPSVRFAPADEGIFSIYRVVSTHPERLIGSGMGIIPMKYDEWLSTEQKEHVEIAILYNFKRQNDFLEEAAKQNYVRCEIIPSTERWQLLIHPQGQLAKLCKPPQESL